MRATRLVAALSFTIAAAPVAVLPIALSSVALLPVGPALAQARDFQTQDFQTQDFQTQNLQARDFAQNKDPAAVDAEPKQVPLTQTQIDGVVAAQKEIHAIEAKVPDKDADKDDPKTDAAIAAAVKKNGFASVEDFANVSFSIGMVLAGVDSQSKQYVGPEAVTKKQMADIQADKTMSAKDKKDALAELSTATKQSPTIKPIDGNIALVSKNYDALNAALQTDAE